jgi:type IV pilus assembly protein PilV
MRRARFSLHKASLKAQRGMLLVEALCAILIFSFGVLGLIGLQASAVSESSDAKLRSAAALLADQYINQMWVSNRSAATVTTVFQPLFAGGTTPGAAYTAWLGTASTAGTVMGTLPGVTASANKPSVTFAAQTAGCSATAPITCTSQVTLILYWQSPHDNTQHQYKVNAQFNLY